MTTRLAACVFIGLLVVTVVPLVAQDHPMATQRSQGQQLPQSTKAAPEASMMQASMSDVSDGLKQFINGYSAKYADNKFHIPFSAKISRWIW
jgi:hypothetical protein